ncbi:hypothetical protein ACOME3_002517 [Neoechinorhynchus agilis]
MHIYLCNGSDGNQVRFSVPEDARASYLFHLLGNGDYHVTCNARAVGPMTPLEHNGVYRCYIRLRAGKGGFGSLLRAFGKQILISNNKDACRDLNGRRIRDVNNEKKLKEWLLKQSKQEEEKPLKNKDRDSLDQKHVLMERLYMRQRSYIQEQVGKAVDAGFELCIQRNNNNRKNDREMEVGRKRAENMLLDDDDFSDSDSEEDEVIRIDQELYDKIMAENESVEEYMNKMESA